MKKMLAILLASMLMMAACNTSSDKNDASNPNRSSGGSSEAASPSPSSGSSSTAKTEPDVIKIAYLLQADERTRENSPSFAYLEEKTNTKIELVGIPSEGGKEKRNILIASNDLPDLISFDGTDDIPLTHLYGSQGLFDAVDPLIEQYAPELKVLLDREETASLRDGQGNMYIIPRRDLAERSPTYAINYRTDILAELGLTEPETLDDWYNVLKVVKEKKPDMIPMDMFGGFNRIFSMLKDAFDIANLSTGYVELKDDKIQNYAVTENFKQLLMYANKMYSEGLYQKEYLTRSYDQAWGDITSGKAFAFSYNSPRGGLANNEARDTKGIELNYKNAAQMKNIHGERNIYLTAQAVLPTGFAISSQSKNKEAIMRMLNWVYSAEGSEWWLYGVPGLTYDKKDGKYYKPGTSEEWNVQSQEFIQAGQEIGSFPGNWPRNVPPELMKLLWPKEMVEGVENNLNYSRYLPVFPISNEDQKELASIRANIKAYYDKAVDEFVIGRRSFDQWDAFVKDMENLNMKREVEIVQKAYDAYLKNLN